MVDVIRLCVCRWMLGGVSDDCSSSDWTSSYAAKHTSPRDQGRGLLGECGATCTSRMHTCTLSSGAVTRAARAHRLSSAKLFSAVLGVSNHCSLTLPAVLGKCSHDAREPSGLGMHTVVATCILAGRPPMHFYIHRPAARLRPFNTPPHHSSTPRRDQAILTTTMGQRHVRRNSLQYRYQNARTSLTHGHPHGTRPVITSSQATQSTRGLQSGERRT